MTEDRRRPACVSLWKLAYRNVLGARSRSLVSVLSMIVVTAAVTVVHSAYLQGSATLDRQALALNGGDVSVTSLLGPLPVEKLEPLRDMVRYGRVSDYTWTLSGQARVCAGDRSALAYVRGVLPEYPIVESPDLVQPAGEHVGELLASRGGAVLKANLAERLGLGVGDSFEILNLGEGGTDVLSVTGLAEPFNQRAGDMSLRGFAFVHYDYALELLGQGDLVFTEAFVRVAPGEDADAVADELRRAFPYCQVSTVEEDVRSRGAGLAQWRNIMLVVVLACVSLGALCCGSALDGLAYRMQPDICVMKACGARPVHIATLYLLLCLQIDGAAALLGATAGACIAYAVSPLLGTLLGFPVTGVPVLTPALLALGVVLVATAASSAGAVVRSVRLSPALLARRAPREEEAGERRGRTERLLPFLLTVAATGVVAVGFRAAWSALLSLLLVVGYRLIVAPALRRLVFVVPRLVKPSGVAGLAVRLLPADPRSSRLILVAAFTTLVAGTAACFLGGAGAAIRASASSQVYCDAMVSVRSDEATRAVGAVRSIDGVVGLDVLHSAPARLVSVNGVDVSDRLEELLAEDPVFRSWMAMAQGFSLVGLEEVPPAELAKAGRPLVEEDRGLRRVAVTETVARPLGITPGDVVRLDLGGAVGEFRVVEVLRRQLVNLGTFVTTDVDLAGLVDEHEVVIGVNVEEGQRDEVMVELRASLPQSVVIPLSDVMRPMDRTMSAAAAVFSVLLALLLGAGAVSAAESVNSLLVERRGEWAVMKAVGASPRQLTALAVSHYTILALLGALLGALLATLVGIVLTYSLSAGLVVLAPSSAAGILGSVLGVTAVTMGVAYLAASRASREAPAAGLGSM